MLIPDEFRKCVAFLCVDTLNHETGQTKRVPVATAFFISMPLNGTINLNYAVTARHNIYDSRPKGKLYLRINIQDGDAFDIDEFHKMIGYAIRELISPLLL